MNKGIIFVGGFAIGFVGGWYLLKDTYKRMAEDEIEAVRERYLKWAERKRHEAEETEQKAEEAFKKYEAPFVNEDPVIEHPYIISPIDFGEDEEYTRITLHFHQDGVLAGEDDEPVDVEMVGRKNLEYFGVYEEDAVYIRDDTRKIDYEVLRVNENHEDKLEHMPSIAVMDVTGDHLIVNDEFELAESEEEEDE